MKNILSSEKVYVNKSKIPHSGRGVFANQDIKKGEIIEKSPIIVIPKSDMSNLNESILTTYFFYFGKNKEKLAVVLGFGSLYNHSYKPNMTYEIKEKEKVVNFIAIKDIRRNEEITFDYKSGDSKNKTPLWFE